MYNYSNAHEFILGKWEGECVWQWGWIEEWGRACLYIFCITGTKRWLVSKLPWLCPFLYHRGCMLWAMLASVPDLLEPVNNIQRLKKKKIPESFWATGYFKKACDWGKGFLCHLFLRHNVRRCLCVVAECSDVTYFLLIVTPPPPYSSIFLKFLNFIFYANCVYPVMFLVKFVKCSEPSMLWYRAD
jgi:hypothetical protein